MRSLLLLAALFAYEPPGTEPIQIRFDQKDLTPQQVPLKMDLQGITLKEDVRLDIHLTGLNGQDWIKGVTYKNCDGMKIGDIGLIQITPKQLRTHPHRDARIDIEVKFGSTGTDKPTLSVTTFGYITYCQVGKKQTSKRIRTTQVTFANGHYKAAMKEWGRLQEFALNWEKHHREDQKRNHAASKIIRQREDLTNEEKNELDARLSEAITLKYEGMPKSGMRAAAEAEEYTHWCKEYMEFMRSIQTASRIHYEAYTIGSAGKTVVGRTVAGPAKPD